MDKRWLGIVVILAAGLFCMYLIVDSSPTVGKSVTVVDEMTITLPSGFNILKDNDTSVALMNHDNKTANITIMGLGDKSMKKYNSALKSLDENGEIEVQKTNKTEKIIYFKNTTSDKEFSLTYFVKDNRTVELKMDKYKDWKDDWNFILETVQHNFKQNK